MSLGGAILIKGVTSNIQGRYFLDFTVHHMHIWKGKTELERPKFSIIPSTVWLVENPDVDSIADKRAILEDELFSLSGVDFNFVQKEFTIVSDGEASVLGIKSSSVRSRLSHGNEKWMRCYVHVLKNSMNSVFPPLADDARLLEIGLDVKSPKHFFEDSKRYAGKADLLLGYSLIKDVGIRFGTLLLVSERFLKSSSK